MGSAAPVRSRVLLLLLYAERAVCVCVCDAAQARARVRVRGGRGAHDEGGAVILYPPEEPQPHRRAHEELQVLVPLLHLGNFEAAVRLRARSCLCPKRHVPLLTPLPALVAESLQPLRT